MRRIFLVVLSIIFLCFLIPIIFTKPFEVVSPKVEEKPAVTIKLYHTATQQIEEVALEEYLYHVVSAEMPASFEKEALMAQAVVARTYTLYQITNSPEKHGEAPICDSSTCCQAWISKEDRLAKWEENERDANWAKIVEAVNATSGKVITYEGVPINAFFHSNSGGITEVPFNVWGGSGYPYLQAVETLGEDGYSQYYSEVELTKQEVIDKIKQTHSDISIDYAQENAISILEYNESGRIKTIKFGNVNLSGVEARQIFGLKSANFTVEILEDKVKFKVTRLWSWSRNEPNRCR